MANIKSQIKRNIKTLKENADNRKSRSKLKTLLKKSLIASKSTSVSVSDKKQIHNEAISYIDSCHGKGLIKKNKASRLKSKIMHAFNQNDTKVLHKKVIEINDHASSESVVENNE